MLIRPGRALSLIFLALLSSPSACVDGAEDDPRENAGVVVRDSAGIEIVENPPLDSLGGTVWTVDSIPVLQIGVQEGGEAYQFTRPNEVVPLADGRIVVLEASTSELRVFDAEGTHILSFGRQGEGPAEFRGAPVVALSPPDTILTWDSRALTLHRWVATSGDYIGAATVTPSLFPTVLPVNLSSGRWSLSPDGTLALRRPLTMAEGVVYTRYGSQPPTYEVRFAVDLVDPRAGSVLTLPDTLPNQRWRERSRVYFTPETSGVFAGGADRFVVSGSQPWQLAEYAADGTLARIVRAPIPSLSTSEALEQVREICPESLSSGMLDAVPDSFPAIANQLAFIPAMDGSLWVRRNQGEGDRGCGTMYLASSNGTYDLIGPDGSWVATMEVPRAAGSVQSMDREHVFVVWRDELRVPYLRKHRIVKARR